MTMKITVMTFVFYGKLAFMVQATKHRYQSINKTVPFCCHSPKETYTTLLKEK